ncbi:3-demethylubiquinone-9 3-methyltransferase [Trichococcus flocculiformis]|uniref:3-demethylubiquinone-9 3-methyltransferase n=1 Tax=Trichococcus flocculiformis TaxID=82803 RepID=A0AB38BKA0_9LACT|nr:VOC family protein [Trichococcus flocculiformis]CZQ95274.1 3-demethylubiquinone-9 3-methyltransferase [Trichococcus flocculiformis]SFI05643.1 Glyoxalase superfamily enzyme, possibly 3-demethylubiquinone-9 3-methyltransferase [Trichococcus flocculiformis]
MSGQRIVPFLTLPGTAEAAMHFYVSIFPNSSVTSLTKIDEDERGEGGRVVNVQFVLNGQDFMAMDMEEDFMPDMTWATSLYVDCEDEASFDNYFDSLSADGVVMMGPEAVGELRAVAWVTDQFGVTWQLVWK